MSKNVLLIGGSTGIGLKLAGILENEHHVTMLSRTKPELKNITHHTVDILDGDLPSLNDPLNGLVYLPGTINLKPFKMLSEENFRDDFELNFLGAVRAIKAYEKKKF